LCLGRLVEYKRIDLVVRAAELLQMPLVIAGDGPERARLERIAGPHTELVGEVNEATAGTLLRDCAAFVFAGEEDFGIALVEANAHGRPVVCYAGGGAAETMLDGRTAVFFHEQTPEAVAIAVRDCLSRTWDPTALKANAARFSPERFREEFAAAVRRVVRA
jgi:glycosyltransferase involved in cell wall biosynthesis